VKGQGGAGRVLVGPGDAWAATRLGVGSWARESTRGTGGEGIRSSRDFVIAVRFLWSRCCARESQKETWERNNVRCKINK
jgi:hypothetical protein